MARVPAFLLVLLLVAPAFADDKPPAAKAKPQTSVEAADAILAAIKSEDEAALKALASKLQPEPWHVVEALCLRTEYAAAEAFAAHTGPLDREPLARFVAAQRETNTIAAARTVYAAMKEAHLAGDVAKEAEVAAQLAAPPTTPLGVTVYFGRGLALRRLRRYAESHGALTIAWKAAREMGWLRRADVTALEAGLSAAYGRMDAKALSAWQARIEIAKELGNVRGEFATRLDVAGLLGRLGRMDEALAAAEAMRVQATAQGRTQYIADSWSMTGRLEMDRQRPAAGLTAYENALAHYEQLGNAEDIARGRGDIGQAYLVIGSYEKAETHLRVCLETLEGLTDKRGQEIPRLIFATRGNLGLTLYRLAEYEEAAKLIEQTLPTLRALRDKEGLAKALTNLGSSYYALGRYEPALENLRAALQLKLELGGGAEVAITQCNLGFVLASLDKLDESEVAFKAAIASEPFPETKARSHKGLATTLLALGRAKEALAHVRQAAEITETLTKGLSTSEAAGRREAFDATYDLGVLAAAQASGVASVSWFLEQGRASSLRERVGGREALELAVVPAALKTRLDEARGQVRKAAQAYRALEGRRVSRTVRKQALKAWREARERVLAVELTIQREARSAAEVSLIQTAELAEIQAGLAADDALVVYGRAALAGPETARRVALVIERSDARVVMLEKPAAFQEIFEDLAWEDFEAQPTDALAKLRTLLIEPLQLREGVRRLLVSPHGELGYLPFAVLAPDKVVAYVPSGTILLQLQSQQSLRGSRVLAIGDPDYATAASDEAPATRVGTLRKLVPLPATRAEVKRIGDVTLLGKEANESRLRATLPTEERWRAIHFACHGLVNAVDPSLSSLALTRTEADDGFLTCLDIFGLRTPADLLVMSACETGKGRVFHAEGIVGLTRAFMHAGAPRVICSLWKVDDEATQALMIKFYELWNPTEGKGLGAADALRKAQEHIRKQEKWKHPYYWAAWVLWGLPD